MRKVRKVEESKETEAHGKSHAVTLMERKGACGDANALHTTGERNKLSASTVEVPFTAQPTVEGRRSRKLRKAKARTRKVKEKERETRVGSKEERQA